MGSALDRVSRRSGQAVQRRDRLRENARAAKGACEARLSLSSRRTGSTAQKDRQAK
jgi:hypothetical protein